MAPNTRIPEYPNTRIPEYPYTRTPVQMNIILLTSHGKDEWNGGDPVITTGLFSLVPGLRECDVLYSKDVEYIPDAMRWADRVIQVGTPSWVNPGFRRYWRACTVGEKPISFLGVGLAVPYEGHMWYGAEDFVQLRDSGVVEQIVCRDKRCYYWLHQKLGFDAARITVLPCPALYSVPGSPSVDKTDVAFSLADTSETSHASRWTFHEYYEKCSEAVQGLEEAGATVTLLYQRCPSLGFLADMERVFPGREVFAPTSHEEFAAFIRKQDVYVGVRNHGALPFAGAGKPSLLLGTDERQFLTDEVPFVNRIDISHARWQAEEILRWYGALSVSGIAQSLWNYRDLTWSRWQESVTPLRRVLAEA